MNIRRSSLARPTLAYLALTATLLTTACTDDGADDAAPPASSAAPSPTGGGPTATATAPTAAPGWLNDPAQAKAEGRVGAGGNCGIPGSFGRADKWSPPPGAPASRWRAVVPPPATG
ncbi:hypothetical protein ABGB16_20595 [Micromonospora sp. B11E3]|uniref:hypothetical protein n=1 Tax=Micromonospora sp. B11E3 TaxID=3153562 RepID=UPI00325D123B